MPFHLYTQYMWVKGFVKKTFQINLEVCLFASVGLILTPEMAKLLTYITEYI